jgi:hypothetical protein
VLVSFNEWTEKRTVLSLGTNAGSRELPFQRWRHFKEAFAPELVARAIAESEIPVHRCIDPFGGSGTTALACQFLGIYPITIEVNPYLADLIEAKLHTYDPDALVRDLGRVMRRVRKRSMAPPTLFRAAPPTFVEPGVNGRWIFDLSVASRVATILAAIEDLTNECHQRLFRVLLGGVLVDVSNVLISGKGRRYRRGWQQNRRDPDQVDNLFNSAVHRAILEIHRYSRRACSAFELIRGDCREILHSDMRFDLAVFSPPYPNSFDYTDVYNVELWALGYLTDSKMNQSLRRSTLCSHVQIGRNFPRSPLMSPILNRALRCLRKAPVRLWNPWIPSMIGAYFADMLLVLSKIHASLVSGGVVWMVMGDSQYADVHIRTADIIAQLAPCAGYKISRMEAFRSMHSSAQQGGRPALNETLLVLLKS